MDCVLVGRELNYSGPCVVVADNLIILDLVCQCPTSHGNSVKCCPGPTDHEPTMSTTSATVLSTDPDWLLTMLDSVLHC
jgi:hypothetical protein